MLALLKLPYYQTSEAAGKPGLSKCGDLGHKNIQTQTPLVKNCWVGKGKKFDFTPVH